MKVLLVTPEFPPHSLGGGGQIVKILAHRLGDRGHSVVVLSGLHKVRNFFDRPYCTTSKDAKVVWLPLLPTPKVGFQLNTIMPPNLYSIVELVRVFLKSDFDIVHIHGYGHFSVDMAAVLSRLSRKPYIYTIHGFPKEPLRKGGILKALYDIYNLVLGKPLVRSAAKTIAVSNSLAKECEFYALPQRIIVIPNALDSPVNPDTSALRMHEVLEKYNLLGKKIVLAIGRLSVAKGFQYAIQAFPLMFKDFPDAQLVIVGKDDGYGYSAELRRLVLQNGLKSRVSFLSGVNDEEKTVLLGQASVVVIPSIEEVFGLVALEAMAAGKPIVASKLGGLAEILAPDKYSILIDSTDPVRLALALVSVLKDKEKIIGAMKNRKNRTERFSSDKMAEQYSCVYKKTASKIRSG